VNAACVVVFSAGQHRALDPIHPGLAQALWQPRRADISGLSDPHQIADGLAELGVKP
jgi:hypothetical protein